MLKKILSLIIFILVVFTAYLLYNTSIFKSKQINYDPANKIDIRDTALHRLAEAIQIRTISTEDPVDFDSTEFNRFVDYLENSYPRIERHLKKTIINHYSFLYEWRGKHDTIKPVILVAHLDVVPAPEEDLNSWTDPPFSGEIKDGKIWGRGAMDDKVGVIGILEAVEHLLMDGFEPQRTIYLAFGHDEENGGSQGAKSIAEFLKTKGVEPEFVLDEGYTITQGLVPGVLTDLALIGIAEKGFASIKLSINLDGGHSAMPNDETAIELITRAISKLENNPFQAEITEPVQQFLEHVGPEMRFQEKLVFANNILFKSMILGIYQQSPRSRAVVQTTMAPTVFNAGIKENVIPSSASSIINFRILPGTTIEEVIQNVHKTIDDDRIQLSLKDFHSEPSKVSSTNSAGYTIINQSVKEVFPYAITAPNLVIAATDGRHYGSICENVYRFIPIRLTPDNINALHGINECIPIEEFMDVIRFYVQLIKNCG